MKKRTLTAWMLALTALLTCGCGFTLSPQELYSLPPLPSEYTELDSRINAILAEGAEYAAPTSGTNIQAVQMVDLDGDGQEEAVAFFRSSTDEKPLKIYIFTAGEQSYEQTALIESSGTGIHSIAYSDLDGDGDKELIVGWRVSTDLKALAVYTLRGRETVELMRTSYVRYAATDLNQDGKQELVVLRADDDGAGLADYYCWQDNGIQLRTSARVSSTMAELSQQGRVTIGKLTEDAPALFVTGVEDSTWVVTDILAEKNGELTNLVLSDMTGVSTEIAPYCSLYPADINGDGLMEVPWPVALYSGNGEESSYQRIDWRGYDMEGAASTVLSTYHCVEDGWYFQLPETWIDQIYASRSTTADEACVTFYRMEEQAIAPILRITAITGSSRGIKAVRGGRFTLGRQAETVFTGELLEGNEDWSGSMTEDQVRGAFRLITKEWTTGDN